MDNKMLKDEAQALIDFLYESPTAYQAVNNVSKILDENNFTKVLESDTWNLEKGGKYYITRNNSAVIAFTVGEESIATSGFRMIGAHTDSPTFKIKPQNGILVENSYVKLNTEVFGGPIFSTWFDRPLSIAGKVVVKSSNIFEPTQHIINLNKPLMVIPNLCIHFNREVNNGHKFNAQVDMLPLLSLINEELEKEDYLLNILANELNVDKSEILDFELFLYEYEKGTVMGLNEELISASRLDDLWMVYAGLQGLIQGSSKSTNVLVCIDHEEIGSGTAVGADSCFIRDILERINLSLGGDTQDFLRALSKSIMISADLAHAVHPNYLDKHDPTNRPMLGKGPVIKYSSNQKYTTTAFSAAIFKGICEAAGVPVQKFVNKSDVIGGSTISKFISSKLGIEVIDMGTPVLGMHSVRELGAVIDNYYVIEAFKKFYTA